MDNPTQEKPILGSPALAEPIQENPTQLNTKGLKTHPENTQTVNPHGANPYPSNPNPSHRAIGSERSPGWDEIGYDEAARYREMVRENMEYDLLVQDRKINRAYILYVAITVIGLSFIAFLALGRSWADYLVVNTLMLGACGVYDLFWWSILGEMLELGKNPAKLWASASLPMFWGGSVGRSYLKRGRRRAKP